VARYAEPAVPGAALATSAERSGDPAP